MAEKGLLNLVVELSTRNITAGREFALFVKITNPFASPVWIREVNVTLPTDLRLAEESTIRQEAKEAESRFKESMDQEKRERSLLGEQLNALQAQIANLQRFISERGSDELGIKSLAEKLQDQCDRLGEAIRNVNVGIARVHIGGAGVKLKEFRIGSQAPEVHIGGEDAPVEIEKLEIYEPWLIHAERSHARTIKLKNSLPDGVSLQPSSTAVSTAILKVDQSLLFTPSTYRLQFYVNYSFEPLSASSEDTPGSRAGVETLFTNTIAHELSIRPPIQSIMAGSVIGGIVGAISRIMQLLPQVRVMDSIVSVFLTAILSGMAVVFMARKTDAQSFVSVEDFWGGVLMGFLIGYTGTSFFENLTGLSNAAARTVK